MLILLVSKWCKINSWIKADRELTIIVLENIFDNLDNKSVQRGLFNKAISNYPPKFEKDTELIWSRMNIDKGDCLVIVGYQD